MVTQQLLDYVSQQVSTGVAKDSIKNALAAQGWSEQDVNEALMTTGELNVPVLQPSVSTVETMQTNPEIVAGSKSKWLLIGGTAFVLVLLGTGAIFAVGSIKSFVFSNTEPTPLTTTNEVANSTRLIQVSEISSSTSQANNQTTDNPLLKNMESAGYVPISFTLDDSPAIGSVFSTYYDTTGKQLENYNIYVFKSTKSTDGMNGYGAFIRMDNPLPTGKKYGLGVLQMKCTGSVAVKMVLSGDVCQKPPKSSLQMGLIEGEIPMYISGAGEVYIEFYVLQTSPKPIMLLHKGITFKVAQVKQSVTTSAETDILNRTKSIKDSISNLAMLAEVYYSTKHMGYKDLCLDEQIKRIEKDVNDSGGVFSCLDSNSAYRASTPLPDKTNLCADSQGKYAVGKAPDAGSFSCP